MLIGPGLFFLAPPLIGLALIGLVGVLLWRAAGGSEGETATPPRKIGLVLLLLVVSLVGFFAVAVGAAAGGGAVIAGLVIAVGAALTVSRVHRRRRWLVLPALILAIPLGFVAAAGIDVDGGVGDRDYRPTAWRELRDGYELGIGELRVDLHPGRPAGRAARRSKLDMGIGSVRVIVPDDVCVASDVRVGAGYARVFDRDSGGPRRRLAPQPERQRRRQAAGDRRRRRHRRAAGRQQPLGVHRLGAARPLRRSASRTTCGSAATAPRADPGHATPTSRCTEAA